MSKKDFYNEAEKLAILHSKLFGISENEALINILNSNDYNYKAYYDEYGNLKPGPDNHFTDKYKTAFHETFSNESIYSGKKSQYNPLGLIGGNWDKSGNFIKRKKSYGGNNNMIYPNIIRGGNAIPIGDNLFLMKGRKHKNGGIDVGKNLEVEGNEVMQTSPNEIRVFSAQKFLGGVSPSELILAGANPDKVFAVQEQYKEEHKINDDGTKKKAKWGIFERLFGSKKDNTQTPVEGEDVISFDNLKLTNGRSYVPQYLTDIYNGLIKRGFTKNQAIVLAGTMAEESGGDVFAKSKDNKFTGLLQWEDSRYRVQYPEDREKETNAQLDYIADTIINAKKRKSEGYYDDWTDGGEGSGYSSWTEAYKDFSDSTNVYNMTRGLNTGYVRPTGGIKGNTGSIINRMNAARQIFENNGITDLSYEPVKKTFGGMSKKSKDTFMDSLIESINDLNKIKLNNTNSDNMSPIDLQILDRELNKDILLGHTPSTGVQSKKCGGRKKAVEGTVQKNDATKVNVRNYIFPINNKNFDSRTWWELNEEEQKAIIDKTPKSILGGLDITNLIAADKYSKERGYDLMDIRQKHHDVILRDRENKKIEDVRSFLSELEKKKCGGRMKASMGTTVIYKDGTKHNTNDDDYDASQIDESATDKYYGKRSLGLSHWLSTGLGAFGRTAAGIIGASINNATNRNYLSRMEGLISKMKSYNVPLTKLKTRFNINPQLSEIENKLLLTTKDIDANTASSQVGLARKRAARLNATLQKNKLHGQKENIETQLINQDRLQQAQTIKENIKDAQNVENQKLQMLAGLVDKRAENATATAQNITGSFVGGIDTLLNGLNQYEQMLAGLAASPNGADAVYGQVGKTTNWRKKAYKKKDDNNNSQNG